MMNDRIIVRNPVASVLLGVLFIAFSIAMIISGFSESEPNRQHSDFFFAVIAAVSGIVVIVMYIMIKYEYDDKGFSYTNAFGKTREISYDEIFSLQHTGKNTLRIELSDGEAISLSTGNKKAKEFAKVIEAAYRQKVRATSSMPMQQ